MCPLPRPVPATSVLLTKVRRSGANGRSSATGSPFLVITKDSPALTAAMMTALWFLRSRWGIVRMA